MEIDDSLRVRIRADRFDRGLTLGELLQKYGAAAVVAALGVLYVADALGVGPTADDTDED